MGLKVIGSGSGRTGTVALREAPYAPALLALAVLAGCAARAPESRPTPPPAEVVPESPPVGALIAQPEPLDVAIPRGEYPHDALDSGFEGSVTLKIVIDVNGRVRKAWVVKDPGHGLGVAAVESALRHFKFKPGQINGKPIATEWTFTVNYVLPRR